MRAIGENRAASCENRPTGHHWYMVAKAKIDNALTKLDGEAIGEERYRLRRVFAITAKARSSSSRVVVAK